MKIHIAGSIKIDKRWRKWLFVKNLESLALLGDIFVWNFNIAGKYGPLCAKAVSKEYADVRITHNDQSPYYQVVKAQMESIGQAGENPIVFMLQEDHWFVCPHKNIFLYLLDEFGASTADALQVTHLTDLWAKKADYKLLKKNALHEEYLTTLANQEIVWKKFPDDRVTSLPGIFKKKLVEEILENNKDLLMQKKNSKNMELHSQKAREFLAKRNVITMAPTMHILREVFWINQDYRAMDAKKALKIIRLRDSVEYIGPWRKTARLILSPRMLVGKIKLHIYGK